MLRWMQFVRWSHALRSPTWEVRAEAAKRLGELNHPKALALLTEALRDPAEGVRQNAFKSVLAQGAAAVPALIDLLHVEDNQLREAAGSGLVQLGPPAIDPLLKIVREERGEARHMAIKALGYSKDIRAVPALQEALSDYDFVVRKLAVAALAKMLQPTIEPLIASLKDWNAAVRASAAEALGQIGDSRVIGPLVKVLGDKEDNVRKAARDALVKLADPRSVHALLESLPDLSNDAVTVAGDVLAAVGKRSVDALEPALASDNAGIRRIAARVVGQCGLANKKKAVEYLKPLMIDKAPAVRATAAEALANLGWKPESAVQRASFAVANNHWDAAIAEGEAAIAALLPVLEEVSRTSRKAAVEALGRIGNASVVKPLAQRLEDTFEDIRIAAIEALTKIGDPRGLQSIFHCLLDGAPEVRKAACLALQPLVSDERVSTAFARLLHDEDEGVRQAAATALGQVEQPATIPT